MAANQLFSVENIARGYEKSDFQTVDQDFSAIS